MREAIYISNSQKGAHKAKYNYKPSGAPSDKKSEEKCEARTSDKKTDSKAKKSTECQSKAPPPSDARSSSVSRLYNEWIFLCASLCLCFLLLLTSGDSLRALSESDGISSLSDSLKAAMQQNTSVAAFFGFDDTDTGEADAGENDSGEDDSIPVFVYGEGLGAQDYIEKYNGISYYTSGQVPVFGTVTSLYSFRENPFYNIYKDEEAYEFHSGIDIAANIGTEILCYLDGTVEKCALSASYGYYVCIDHGEGLKTLYAHASEILCEEGDKVKKGQPIALVGDTGRSTGAHLHFEVERDGETVNPKEYLSELFEQ